MEYLGVCLGVVGGLGGGRLEGKWVLGCRIRVRVMYEEQNYRMDLRCAISMSDFLEYVGS